MLHNNTVVPFSVDSPDSLINLFSAEDLSRIHGQQLHNVKFCLGQPDRLVMILYLPLAVGNKKLLFQNRVTSKQLILDRAFVSQVCNNLISNAIRYADTTVTLDVEGTDEGLLLTVSDDGKGFSKETLVKVANPYFTEEKNHAEHFGLGLYICKLLCEHHGGYLKLKNLDNGAQATAFFRSPNCR